MNVVAEHLSKCELKCSKHTIGYQFGMATLVKICLDDYNMQQGPLKPKKITFHDETATTFPTAKLICGYTGIRPSIGPGHVAYLKAAILQDKYSKKKIYNGRLFDMNKL